jgi:hypothetical protein
MKEFEINGVQYSASKIGAREQFHIVRRLAPVLGEIIPAVQSGDTANGLPKAATAISGLSDSDADYVLFGLLQSVKRKQAQGLGWSPVSTGNQLMFEDIDMGVMLRLAWEALLYNVGGFFPVAPSALSVAAPKPNAQ